MHMPHWPTPLYNANDIKYDLTRISELLVLLGNPHEDLAPIIHVAGTNGKGSTTAFLFSILKEAGYKVHVYTSPHLIHFNERIVINNHQITDDYLYYICEKVRLIAEKHNINPTFFEATTAAAFFAFSENTADIVLLETGMGGRLDATNIIKKPLCTVITPISYDHMDYLGPTLEIIAREKAGIIKLGSPTYISMQTESLYEVLFDYCTKIKAPYYAYEHDFGIQKIDNGFSLMTHEGEFLLPTPSLQGDHQLINAGVVAFIAKTLLRQKFNITDQHIVDGIVKAEWLARIQKINLQQTKFKDSKAELWVDGAHNVGGAQALSEWLREYKASTGKNVSMILGMTKNRDANAFSSFFRGMIDNLFCVQVRSEPSSYPSEKLKNIISWNDFNKVAIDSLEEALLIADKNSDIIIVTGSLFLASDLFKLLYNT